MVETKKSECATALKETKSFCKKFGFTVGMLKNQFEKGSKKK